MMTKQVLFGLCVFLLVAPSFQHGVVLVDNVRPVNNDAVHFTSAKSETATVGSFQASSLSVTSPGGLLATPPGTAEFGGQSVELLGELGVAIGSSTTNTNINAGGDFTGLSQSVNINTGGAFDIQTVDDITFESGRSVSLTGLELDFEGLFGFVVESRLSNVDMSAGVEFFSFSDELSISADDKLSIASTNEVDITSTQHDVAFSGKRISMHAVENVELIAETDLDVTAEDAIHSYSGVVDLTSLGNLRLESATRNVDLTAGDAIRLSGSNFGISASDRVFIAANKYVDGDVLFLGETSTDLSAGSVLMSADGDITFSHTAGHSITAVDASLTANSEIHIGTEGTDTITIGSMGNVIFELENALADELDVLANNNLTIDVSGIDVSGEDDILASSQTIDINITNDLDIDAFFLSWSSLADPGFFRVTGNTASLNAADNFDILAASVTIDSLSIAVTAGDNYDAQYELTSFIAADTINVSAEDDITLSGANVHLEASDAVLMTGNGVGSINADTGDVSILLANSADLTTRDCCTSFVIMHQGAASIVAGGNIALRVVEDDDDESVFRYDYESYENYDVDYEYEYETVRDTSETLVRTFGPSTGRSVDAFQGETMAFLASGSSTVNAAETLEVLVLQDTIIDGFGVLSFTNINSGDEGEQHFVTRDDITFQGTDALPAEATITANTVSFDAGGDLALNGDDISITATDSFEVNVVAPYGSVDFDVATQTTVVSDDIAEFEAGGDLVFTFERNEMTSPDSRVNAVNTVSFSGDELIVSGTGANLIGTPVAYTGSISMASDEAIFFDSDSTVVDARNGDLALNAVLTLTQSATPEINVIGGDVSFNGGDITSQTGVHSTTATGSGSITANTDGAVISVSAPVGDISLSAADTSSVSAETWLSNSGSIDVSANGDIEVTGTDAVTFAGPLLDLQQTGDLILNADNVEVVAPEGETIFNVAGPAEFMSQEEVFFTSEGDITFLSTRADGVAFQTTTPEAIIVSDQGVDIESTVGSIVVTALVNEDDSIAFVSEGNTEFFAETGDIDILSEDDLFVTAGRSIQLQSFLEGGLAATATLGDFVVQAPAASIFFEAAHYVNITANRANNATDVADISFAAGNGLSIESDEGGLLFDAFSAVPSSGSDNIIIQSAAPGADVVFDATRGQIVAESVLAQSFTAASGAINMQIEDEADFTSINDLSFVTSEGEFDVVAYRGLTVTAGSAGFGADLTLSAGGFFDAATNGVIDIRSEGPIADGDLALDVTTAAGGILFSTANAGDQRYTATASQTFSGANFRVLTAVNDLYVETTAGSLTTVSQTSGEFSTSNGPIEITATTGSLGGAVTIDAVTQSMSFSSGESATFSAEEAITVSAETGITLLSEDGRLTLAAEASTSNIEMLASDELTLVSLGARYHTPADGVSFDAANNVVFGTTSTDSVSFGSVNLFQIGSHTRPIVNINAGGSSSQDGFVINSVGGIYLQSNHTFTNTVAEDFIVAVQNGGSIASGGPLTIEATSSSSDVTIEAQTGILRLTGDNTDVLAPGGIEGTTSGLFSVGSSGARPADRVQLQAPLVNMEAGSIEWASNVVKADVADSFSITSTGDASFTGSSTSGSDTSILFTANSDGLVFNSRDSASFESRKIDGTITFGSDEGSVSLETRVNSDMEITAGNEVGIHSLGSASLVSSRSKINIDANDLTSNDNGDGDVEILASGDLSADAVRNTLWQGEASTTLQTTGTENNVGGALDLTATGQMSISSVFDMTIANTLNEGGEISFIAESTLSVEAEGSIELSSDADVRFEAARDVLWTMNDDYFGNVREDMTFTTDDANPTDDYGVFIDGQDVIEFRSLFGSIEFSGARGVDIGAEETTVSALREASITGTTGTTVTGEDLDVTAAKGKVLLNGQQGYDIVAGTTMTIASSGIDDSATFGTRITSAGRHEIRVEDTLDITASEAFEIAGSRVELTSGENMLIEVSDGDYGDILVEGEALVSLFAADLELDSQDSIISSGGYIHFDSDAEFTADAQSGPMVLETTGSDANVEVFAAGPVDLNAPSGAMRLQSEELPGSNVVLRSDLGRMNMALDDAKYSAGSGDFTIDLPADDGDFYVEVEDDGATIVANGQVVIGSPLSAPGLLGMDIAADDLDITTSDYVRFSSNNGDLELTADDFDFDANPTTRSGFGGAVVLTAGSDISFDADSVVMLASEISGSLYLSADQGDIEMDVTRTGFSSNIFVRIPEKLDVISNQCTPGEIFITTSSSDSLTDFYHAPFGYTQKPLVCVCDPFPYNNSGFPQGTPALYCAAMAVAPCNYLLDPECNLFGNYIGDVPGN